MGNDENSQQYQAQNITNKYAIQNIQNRQIIQNDQKKQKIHNLQNSQNFIPEACYLGCNRSVPIKIINKASKSICKIIIKRNPHNILATGFFMKVSDNEKYLITNNHVISQNNINDDIEIEI